MKYILEDLSASIAVFLVALPLCLGMALASDAPLVSGVIAGIIGGVLVGVFGGSEVSVSGPAAGLVVVVSSAIHDLGSYQLFSFAIIIAGILQIIFALIGLHRFTNIIPQSVVKGMLSAIGILICIKEFPYLIGIKNSGVGVVNLSGTRWSIVCVSIATAIVILLWEHLQTQKKSIKNIPAPLMGVVFGTIISCGFMVVFPGSMSTADYVQLPGLIDHFMIYMPNMAFLDIKVIKTAIVISLIASVETLLCLEASLQLDYLKRPIFRRKEIVAQGLGNITCGFLGGLPITAVIVRTAANINAGACTRKATILHGILIGIFAIFLVDIANWIPLSSLAVVLVLVGYKLFSPKIFIAKKKKGNLGFAAFVITIIAIVLSDLLIGVAIGTVFYHVVNHFRKKEDHDCV